MAPGETLRRWCPIVNRNLNQFLLSQQVPQLGLVEMRLGEQRVVHHFQEHATPESLEAGCHVRQFRSQQPLGEKGSSLAQKPALEWRIYH